MTKFFNAALIALVFVSCQTATEKETTTDADTISSTTIGAPVPTPDSNSLNAIVNAPGTASPAGAPAPGTSGAGSSASGGLNPAHGAPGHRCDIAVGAPLSTPVSAAAPATNASPTMIQQQAPAQPAMAQPTSGSGRTNPPHGASGHDCGVPVGAPLKS